MGTMWRLLVRFAPRLVVAVTPGIRGQGLAVSAYAADADTLRRRGLRSLDALLAASPYWGNGEVRSAILAFKYRYHPLLHRRLADMIVAAARGRRVPLDGAVLCPVPCTWFRRHRRGYNQAELLALSAGRSLGLPVASLLRRCGDRGAQTGRSRSERLAARTGTFAVRRWARMSRRVILVDDVATTGATLDACAAALKAVGAVRVEAWVVAHDHEAIVARARAFSMRIPTSSRHAPSNPGVPTRSR